MITGVISHPVSRGGKAPQPCVLSSRCQKRALGGFHDSSFPLPEPQAAAGDTRKARGGKGRHCKSTRRKRQTPPSFGGCRARGGINGPPSVGAFWRSFQGWGCRCGFSLRREAGLDPQRGLGGCGGGGGCEHPSPAAPRAVPRAVLVSPQSHRAPRASRSQWEREALSTERICWCCSPFLPSLFITLSPPADVFSPAVNECEVFPSLQLTGPSAAAPGELRGAALGGCGGRRGKTFLKSSHGEKDTSLSAGKPLRIPTWQHPQG